MSLTYINLEASPNKQKPFGLASGMIEDFLLNPLEKLRTLKCDKISGSWDLTKIREILNKIKELALQNNTSHEIIDPPKISSDNERFIEQKGDYRNHYSSFEQSQKFDNKPQRIQQIVKDFENRVIYRSYRSSSVQSKTIQQPKKCKLISKEFEQKLNSINQKYGMKTTQIVAKSKYLDHYSINSNNQQKSINTYFMRPQTTCSARKSYSFRRERTYDLDQKHLNTTRTNSKRAQSGYQMKNFESEKQNVSIIAKIMKKSQQNKKVNLKKYHLENNDIQPTFMLDDNDLQTNKLIKCIQFNPLDSIQKEYRNFMPNDDDFILKLNFQQIQTRRQRQNPNLQKAFYAQAQSKYLQDSI
ncbi:unnamed protein product [Paramecium octaurelia]|uniref:Uncharacterized protein n=1 Tax=Paramecium octaurelia TaxID=43137 RepID=A0A8S1VQ15_PAROT|nr:unnamed protein product [Paramecium octaurelia]